MPLHGSLDSFGAILSGLAKRLGLESRLLELRIQHQWQEIVGEPVASHTWPSHIRFKKLYLVVPNSVWLQQLTFLKPSLLAKLRPAVGTDTVTEIVFRIGEIPPPTAAPYGVSSTNAAASDLEFEIDPHTASIGDLDLRKRFTSVIARYPVPPRPARDQKSGL